MPDFVPVEWTPEQIAELQQALDGAQPHWIATPPAHRLRDFLKANATVVAPGETLIIRTTDLGPNQIREYQKALDSWREHGGLPFRCVVVHGEGFGVAPEVVTLVAEGKMSVNAARKALGLPAWPVPEFDEAREIS